MPVKKKKIPQPTKAKPAPQKKSKYLFMMKSGAIHQIKTIDTMEEILFSINKADWFFNGKELSFRTSEVEAIKIDA